VDYCCGKFDALPTRSSVKKAIRAGAFLLNGQKAIGSRWIHQGDQIELFDLERKKPKPYVLDIPVVYEDDYLAVVNKPSGISVSGNQFRTVENAMVDKLKLSSAKDAFRWAKPVHRLDNPTSGLLIMAKTASVRILLGEMFEKKQIKKVYRALVMGDAPAEGCWDSSIEGQEAVTEFRRIGKVRSLKNDYLSLLELQLHTGRTHQIRIHTSLAGFPILGDKLYGKEGEILKGKGLFLCAVSLCFSHPVSKEPIHISIQEPPAFAKRMQNEQRRWEKYHPA